MGYNYTRIYFSLKPVLSYRQIHADRRNKGHGDAGAGELVARLAGPGIDSEPQQD